MPHGILRWLPAWGTLWEQLAHVNMDGMSGISTASMFPELTAVLWLRTRIPFLGRHT